nr:hypothetical protein [Hamadaea tsunoensis]
MSGSWVVSWPPWLTSGMTMRVISPPRTVHTPRNTSRVDSQRLIQTARRSTQLVTGYSATAKKPATMIQISTRRAS